MRKTVETRFVEAICKDFSRADAAAVVEVEFEVTTVAGCIGVHESLGISKRVEDSTESLDLLSYLCLFPRMARKSKDLVEEQTKA
jgi:hypothetical protein